MLSGHEYKILFLDQPPIYLFFLVSDLSRTDEIMTKGTRGKQSLGNIGPTPIDLRKVAKDRREWTYSQCLETRHIIA